MTIYPGILVYFEKVQLCPRSAFGHAPPLLMDGTTDPYGIFEQDGLQEECGSKIGPWGINDYLSWYVTDTHNVGSVTTTKCIYDDD